MAFMSCVPICEVLTEALADVRSSGEVEEEERQRGTGRHGREERSGRVASQLTLDQEHLVKNVSRGFLKVSAERDVN